MRKVSRAEDNYTNLNFANVSLANITDDGEADAAEARVTKDGIDTEEARADRRSPVIEKDIVDRLVDLHGMEGGPRLYEDLRTRAKSSWPSGVSLGDGQTITLDHFRAADLRLNKPIEQ